MPSSSNDYKPIDYIDVTDEVDVSLWALVFATSPEAVRDAVAAVGNSPSAVQAYLIGRQRRD